MSEKCCVPRAEHKEVMQAASLTGRTSADDVVKRLTDVKKQDIHEYVVRRPGQKIPGSFRNPAAIILEDFR